LLVNAGFVENIAACLMQILSFEVLAQGACPLLPNEPRVLDWTGEQVLTERYLLSAGTALASFLLAVRTQLDPVLRERQPTKLGKPYPLGQCLEISEAVQVHLAQLDPDTLPGVAAKGHAALAAFLAAGGSARQVWGDLRGQYFQNAFLIGTLYVDVSNDTVVPTKPKVEILPFTEANFRPIEDYHHFARVACSYWRAEVMPNHLLPELAPYLPMITAIPGGKVQLGMPTDYMLSLTQRSHFRASASFLEKGLMAADIFGLLKRKLTALDLPVAADPEQGRGAAVSYCHQYRRDASHLDKAVLVRVLESMRCVNACFSTLSVQSLSA
jgi:hypothetical protein